MENISYFWTKCVPIAGFNVLMDILLDTVEAGQRGVQLCMQT